MASIIALTNVLRNSLSHHTVAIEHTHAKERLLLRPCLGAARDRHVIWVSRGKLYCPPQRASKLPSPHCGARVRAG